MYVKWTTIPQILPQVTENDEKVLSTFISDTNTTFMCDASINSLWDRCGSSQWFRRIHGPRIFLMKKVKVRTAHFSMTLFSFKNLRKITLLSNYNNQTKI